MGSWLYIPKNEIGAQEYDVGIEESKDIVTVAFPEDEIVSLFDDGVFDRINKDFDLGIDDYEHAEIPPTLLKNTLECIDKNLYPVFHDAIGIAIMYEMPLMIDL